MRTGPSRHIRRPGFIAVALFAALSLASLAGCGDNSPVAAPTSTLPEQAPDDDATDTGTEVDIPDYETDLDLSPEEEEAVDGALVALDGYVTTLNETFSSGGYETDRIAKYAQGEALRSLREDSDDLRRDEQIMAGRFKIENREIQDIDLKEDRVTVLTCVDNSAFAKVAKGESLPKSAPEPLSVIFNTQRSGEEWKVDSQDLWSEPCGG
ncbi:hypothetical protein [Brevibacterium oceani]|uniref:hypothetical protein n=1 Tax=Brevibacterium oceani TaxID=358099 RepID=UPI001B343577|nr:hypothetical protein [Brevibacterium oceani]